MVKILKNINKFIHKEEFPDVEIIVKYIYEYGNGIYAEPFWVRVNKQMDKIKENYEIIDIIDNFIPSHYCGKNCMNMDYYRGDELYRTVICKSKEK